MTASIVLAYDPNSVKPGWIAFFFVVALCIATFFLWRNMNKQLGKVKLPYSAEFRNQKPEQPAAPPRREPPSADGPPDPTA
jgi:hypothetical protein